MTIVTSIPGENGIKLDEYQKEVKDEIIGDNEGKYLVKINKGSSLFITCTKEGYLSISKRVSAKSKIKEDFYLEEDK